MNMAKIYKSLGEKGEFYAFFFVCNRGTLKKSICGRSQRAATVIKYFNAEYIVGIGILYHYLGFVKCIQCIKADY